MAYRELYNSWLESSYIDENTKNELRSISDEKEIEDRFYKSLEFGTAGMRGVIAAGDNRMNVYTVRKASEGLARYVDSVGGNDSGVVIAYDSRHMSKEFALETALVICGHNIKTYLYDDIRPVPMLSFAVRELKCAAGVVITASHNPSKYNGYKVYGSHGGQIEPEDAKDIIKNIGNIKDFAEIVMIDESEAKNTGLLISVPDYVDENYFTNISSLVSKKEIFSELGDDFKLVYTPLHGSGRMPVLRALKDAGVKGVEVVEEQLEANGDFPTVKAPNPEEAETLKMAIELSKKVGADICLGTDPDCDRMGVAIKMDDGSFKTLSGNQIGCLMLDYLLNAKKENGTLPENGAVVKTIVSTEMAKAIAESYGVTCFDVLTGFKYIAGLIGDFEEANNFEYQFGFEESFGFMAGPFVRDKDAVQACLIMTEMAAWYKSQGMTPYQGLIRLYEKYGYYIEETVAYSFPGKEGSEKMAQIINNLRNDVIENISTQKVIEFRDYSTSKGLIIENGNEFDLTLPKADVLYYVLDGDGKFVVRPSGTEPKIKFYYGVKGNDMNGAKVLLNEVKEYVEKNYL